MTLRGRSSIPSLKTPGAFYRMVKQVFDPLAAVLLLALFSPLMLLIAVLIRVGSPGPFIFRQQRGGRGNRPFTCYKFRTMRSGVDPFGPSPHSPADPRMTPIGRFLRQTSLDELPQLFNVLKGDISLVGPRPLYVRHAAGWDARQRRRLEVKPGLTGLAQVFGRGGLTIEDKLELDVRYVEQACIRLDLWLLWMTLISLFRKQDIYEKKYSRYAEIEPEGSSRNKEPPA
jgi:lipopolysaccharide/colanic/teichoic acid biosynthesis glycosyltransferase